MKRSLFLTPLLLVACASPSQMTLDSYLQNPLYAEQYAEDLVDSLVEMEIRQDAIIQDEDAKEAMDDARREWLDVARTARQEQNKGAIGPFIQGLEYVTGEALYLNDTLYFGPTFDMKPGPGPRVYLTSVADPRTVDFPDDTAIDLGELITAYGAQEYAVPMTDQPELLQTAVVYDTKLQRVYNFAQLVRISR